MKVGRLVGVGGREPMEEWTHFAACAPNHDADQGSEGGRPDGGRFYSIPLTKE